MQEMDHKPTTFTDILIRMLRVNSDMNEERQKLSGSDLVPQAWWHLVQEEAGEVSKEASKFVRYFESEYAKNAGEVPHLFRSRDSKEQIFECFIQELLDLAVAMKYAMDISFDIEDLDVDALMHYVEVYTTYKLDRQYANVDKSKCPHLKFPIK